MAFLGIGKKKKPILPALSFSGGQASFVTPQKPAKPALSGSGTPSGTNSLIVTPKAPSAVTMGPGTGAPLLQHGATSGSTNINLKPYAVPAPSSNATSLQVTPKPPASKPTTALSGTPTSTPPPTPNQSYGPPPSFAMQGATSSGDGFTSSDPAIQDRIAEMNRNAEASAAAQRATAMQPVANNETKPVVGLPPQPAGLSVIDQLRGKVSSLSQISPEEQALQDELAQLRGDAQMGISNLEGQGRGIPLGLVRGQKAKLEEQAAIKEGTLMERLAAASAARQNALLAAQNEYTMAANELARQDQLTAPISAGGSILQFDPATGQYKTVYSAPQATPESPTSVQEYQFAQQQGYTGDYTSFLAQKAAFSQNPANLQFVAPTSTFGGGVFNPETGQFDAAPTAPKQVSQLTTDALGLINQLVAHPGLKGATGGIRIALPGSEAANFNAQLDRLKSLLSLENISYLKGTGAMSDREFATLSSAAAALDPKMSSEAFLAELQRIQQDLQSEAGGGGDYIDQFLNSFSGAGSQALNGSYGDINRTQGLPGVQKTVSTILGKGIITGYGSKFWEPGLDFVLPGGKNADVKWPTSFQVISLDPENKTGGFGNRAKIRTPDGKEMWVSHLSNFNRLQPGQTYPAGTIIGKQGNTGKTYGQTGIHLDLTMPKPGGGYYTAEQVASYLKATA